MLIKHCDIRNRMRKQKQRGKQETNHTTEATKLWDATKSKGLYKMRVLHNTRHAVGFLPHLRKKLRAGQEQKLVWCIAQVSVSKCRRCCHTQQMARLCRLWRSAPRSWSEKEGCSWQSTWSNPPSILPARQPSLLEIIDRKPNKWLTSLRHENIISVILLLLDRGEQNLQHQ